MGAANQRPGRSGFAHLFEHMMFSGSQHVPDPDKVLAAIGAGLGGAANGTTNFDRTNYFETVPASQLPTALWIESDRMGFLLPTLDAKKLASPARRGQQRAAAAHREPALRTRLPRAVRHAVSRSRTPTTTASSGASRRSRPRASRTSRASSASSTRPGTPTLAIVGDFDPKVARELVTRYFGDLPGGGDARAPDVPQPRSWTGWWRRPFPTRWPRIPQLQMAWNGVKPFAPDEAAGDILSVVLGGSKTSRLYRRLVEEKQIASGVFATNASLGLGGYFQIVATARGAHTVAELRKEVEAVLDELRKEGPTPAEVERAKRIVVGGMVRSVERISGKADQLNAYTFWTGDPGYLPKDVARYQGGHRRAGPRGGPDAASGGPDGGPRRRAFARRPLWEPGHEPPAACPPSACSCSRWDAPRASPRRPPWPPPRPRRRTSGGTPSHLRSRPSPPSGRRSRSSARCPNRLTVLLRENHAVPVVVVELAIRTGVDGDPPDRAGLADFVAGALDEGTRTRTSQQLAEQLEDLAATLGVSPGLDGIRLHLNCLSDTLEPALDLIADVALNPAFRPADVERVRGITLTGLEQRRGNPGALASDEVARLLYGPKHPWGQPAGGTVESVKAIRRQDLLRFHDTYFRPNNALLSVSGDFEPEKILALLAERFGAWRPKSVPPSRLPPFPKEGPRGPSSPWTCRTAPRARWRWPRGPSPRPIPDALALSTANVALGGLFTSRLNQQLREVRGWTYGMFSSVGFNKRTGVFQVRGSVVAQHTVDSLKDIEAELKRYATGDITDSELQHAKEGILQSLPQALETNDAVASTFVTLSTLGRPLDWYATLPGSAGRART